MLSRLLQRFWCAFWRGHGFYFEDIKRIDDVLVTGVCFKCGTKFTAYCGLDLPGSLYGWRASQRRCEGCQKGWPFDSEVGAHQDPNSSATCKCTATRR